MFSPCALRITTLSIFVVTLFYSWYQELGIVVSAWCVLGIVLTLFLILSPSPENKKLFVASALISVFLLSITLYQIEIPTEGPLISWIPETMPWVWWAFKWLVRLGGVWLLVLIIRWSTPFFSRVWGSVHPISGESIRKRKFLMIVAILALVHLFVWRFLPEKWADWDKHRDLFWAINLGVVLTLWFALSGVLGAGGKWVAIVFAGLFILISFYLLPTTKDGAKFIAGLNRPTPVSVPVAKAVELPRGTLKCEPGPEIQAITGWPQVYELEIRNIDILPGAYINFDLWKEGVGKYGEYRWDKDVSPRSGRFTRFDKPVTGTWRLVDDLPSTPRYSMILKGSHKADGAVHDEPMTLYVKVQ